MNKILTIGWKDILLIVRDRAALILMLAAPFALILGLGAVTGAFSAETNSGIPTVQVALVNLDDGELGSALTDLLTSEDLADLLAVQTLSSADAARQLVAEDAVAAAVIVPAGYSAAIIPDSETGQTSAETLTIEIIENPGSPISAGVVASIVNQFVTVVDNNLVSIEVSMTQLIGSGIIDPANPAAMMQIGQAMGERLLDTNSAEAQPILIQNSTNAPTGRDFNPLAYLAPGMAVLFLMYTATQGGSSILRERDAGTLGRLLVSPTATAQILSGKTLGIFLTGVAQLTILIGGSALLFGLDWGNPLGVLLIILATCAAATGWGLLLASLAKTPAQVNSIGTALMLGFGILGGSFVPIATGGLLGVLRKFTPNAWALDSFTELATGGTLADIAPMLLALILMTLILFAISVAAFSRNQQKLA